MRAQGGGTKRYHKSGFDGKGGEYLRHGSRTDEVSGSSEWRPLQYVDPKRTGWNGGKEVKLLRRRAEETKKEGTFVKVKGPRGVNLYGGGQV